MRVSRTASPPIKGATRKKAPARSVSHWFTGLNIPRVGWRWPLAGILLAGSLYGVSSMASHISWSVDKVQFEQVLIYQDRAAFQVLLDSQVGRNLLAEPISQLKDEIEELPWIASAEIQFQWPGVLYVQVSEEKPVAVWNKTRLISQTGKLFEAEVTDFELPGLSGRDKDLEQVMSHYLNFNRSLLGQGQIISELAFSDGGAWTLITESGLTIKLGSSDVLRRFNRALTFIDGTGNKIDQISYIDARYNNGIAYLTDILNEEKTI